MDACFSLSLTLYSNNDLVFLKEKKEHSLPRVLLVFSGLWFFPVIMFPQLISLLFISLCDLSASSWIFLMIRGSPEIPGKLLQTYLQIYGDEDVDIVDRLYSCLPHSPLLIRLLHPNLDMLGFNCHLFFLCKFLMFIDIMIYLTHLGQEYFIQNIWS